MSINADESQALQQKVWQGSIPLHVTLAPSECRTYNDSLPYLVQYPRLSYLPSLLPKLHNFFRPSLIDPTVAYYRGWLSFEEVPLKWQQPVGLLYDTFSGAEPINHETDARRAEATQTTALPWKLVLHFSNWPTDLLIPLDAEGRIYHDSFINSVKEADFLRNGTAKIIMSLSKDDSTRLWDAVQEHDLAKYNTIYHKFLNPSDGAALRHIPMKLYLPTGAVTSSSDSETEQVKSTLKVVQALATPMLSAREPQTLGTVLHNQLPTVFPSRRSYIFAQAVLHGSVVPMSAPIEQLMRGAAYADGFLHVSIVMLS